MRDDGPAPFRTQTGHRAILGTSPLLPGLQFGLQRECQAQQRILARLQLLRRLLEHLQALVQVQHLRAAIQKLQRLVDLTVAEDLVKGLDPLLRPQLHGMRHQGRKQSLIGRTVVALLVALQRGPHPRPLALHVVGLTLHVGLLTLRRQPHQTGCELERQGLPTSVPSRKS